MRRRAYIRVASRTASAQSETIITKAEPRTAVAPTNGRMATTLYVWSSTVKSGTSGSALASPLVVNQRLLPAPSRMPTMRWTISLPSLWRVKIMMSPTRRPPGSARREIKSEAELMAGSMLPVCSGTE